MKKITKMVLAFSLIASTASTVLAQENKAVKVETASEDYGKAFYSIEIDPATFMFRGYGFHFRYKPKNTDHVVLGFGTYGMNFPDVLVDLNGDNKEQGWDVRLNQGYGLFGEYHFSEVNKKWFAGAQIATQEYKIQKDYFDGESKYNTMLLMAMGGYTVQPFDFPVYFKFWGGVGYSGKIGGENTIGKAEYKIDPLLLFGALHIGYTFKSK